MVQPGAAVGAPVCYRRARWLSGAALLSIGVYTAALGPLLPDLAGRAGVSLGRAGALFTALFAAAIVSTLVAGRMADRAGRRRPLVAGLALNGLALVTLTVAPSWPALLAAAALLGLGDGAVIVCTHVLVAEANRGREAPALNMLNVYFGVGAVLGPAMVALARRFLADGAVVLALVGLLQLGYAMALTRAPLPAATADGRDRQRVAPPLLASRLLWLLAALLLVYVGIEIGLGAWAFTYGREAAGIGGTAAALLSSGFWCALTLGRLASAPALRRMTPEILLLAGPLVAAVGSLLLVCAGSVPVVLVLGVLLAGFGFGPVWPVTFALSARTFSAAAGSAGGLLAMISAVGGLSLPWLQGAIIAGAGPTAGIGMTLIGCLVVAVFAVASRRENQRLRGSQ
jgi:fucose permease